MKPVMFEEAHALMVAENCIGLPTAIRHNNQFNADEYISCWEPGDDELAIMLKDLSSGKRPRIYVNVIGGQPPMYIGTDAPKMEG